MTSHRTKSWIQLGAAASLIIALIIAFTLPIGNLPILGKLLFPGTGIWLVPGEISKTEKLKIPSLSGDVDILRDQWGVPHIYGDNEADCVFAVGYCHAQDRLFMMEMARRVTRGNLSEILGPEYVEVDQFNLLMLKDYWSVATYEAIKAKAVIDPETNKLLQILENYTAGVNYYIEHSRELPIEFQLLNFKMEPWTTTDSLCMAKYMAEDLTWGYDDIYRLLAMDAIGEANYTELLSNPQPYQVPICPNYGTFPDQPIGLDSLEIPASASSTTILEQPSSTSIPTQVSSLCDAFLDALEQIPQEQHRMDAAAIKGSNNWVVDGNKSATGKPILCNDMHLGWNLPGIWYEIHIIVTSEMDSLNLWGFTLPGVPYPLVGHNSNIGWGFTNTNYDVLDWYYYDGYDDNHYWYRGQLEEYEYITYQIPVRGQDPVDYTIKTTVHGPVFTEVFDDLFLSPDYTNTQLACRWIAHNVTWELNAFYGFAHATNRAEFNTASTNFWTPAQNMVYADVDGNIGIRPTGKVPLRNDTGIPSWHLGHGFMPYNGSAGQGEWTGFVPFADLPHTENPDQHYLASANQIVAGPAYLAQYQLQGDYSQGYRARRINEWLKVREDIVPEDMQSLQFDRYGVDAGNFTPYLLTAIEDLPVNTTQQQDGYILLRNWDREMNKDLAAPTLFNAWQEIYLEMTFLDDLEVVNLTHLERYISNAIMENLTKNDPTSKWFDNITTPLIETRDEIIIAAFNRALAACEAYFGTPDVDLWYWGDIHQNYFEHLLGLEVFSYGPISTDGTSDTVNPTYSNIWRNGQLHFDVNQGGASERVIMDFSDLNNTLSIIPSGQRGNPGSKHYTDQLKLYLGGLYHLTFFGCDEIDLFPIGDIESRIVMLGGT